MLLSHTVLSELYQERLVTEDDVERMKRVGGDILSVQFAKPPDVVTRTADLLDKWGFGVEASILRGW